MNSSAQIIAQACPLQIQPSTPLPTTPVTAATTATANSLTLHPQLGSQTQASQPILPKVESPASSNGVGSPIPNVSQALVSPRESPSLSTLNLLNYWQYTFRVLDSAVSNLLEATPLSPHVPLSEASSYYPPPYSPSFPWVSQEISSYVFPPTLELTTAVLTPQQQYTSVSLAPQPLILPAPNSNHQSNPAISDLKISTIYALHAKLPTPVSPRPQTLKPVVTAVLNEQKLPYPDPIQSAESSQQHKHIQHLDVRPILQPSSQQLETVPSAKELNSQPLNPTNPSTTQSAQESKNVRNTVEHSPLESKTAPPHPIDPLQKPKNTDFTALQSIPQPQFGISDPTQISQQTGNILIPVQSEQHLNKPLPIEQIALRARPVAGSTRSTLKITDEQKVKFVNTYQRVDAAGKAKLEATLRKNRLWDHFSALLHSTVINDGGTKDCQVTQSGPKSNSDVQLNPTVVQPPLASSSSMVPPVIGKPPMLIPAAEGSHKSEIVSSSQSISSPLATPKSTISGTKILFETSSMNIGDLNNKSLDPILSHMIIAMLAPQPQANTVLMAAFDTLGIHNNNAITTHLMALADCSHGTNDTFWKLRAPDGAAALPALTSPRPSPIHQVQPITPPQAQPPKDPEAGSSTVHQAEQSTTHEAQPPTSHQVDSLSPPPVLMDISSDSNNHDLDDSTMASVDAAHEEVKTNVKLEDDIGIISLHEFNRSKSITPGARRPRSPTDSKISAKSLKTSTSTTQRSTPKDLPSPLHFNFIQDDLPGFPDVNPEIQNKGGRAQILARYAADDQMPPVRTFVPLSRKKKSK